MFFIRLLAVIEMRTLELIIMACLIISCQQPSKEIIGKWRVLESDSPLTPYESQGISEIQFMETGEYRTLLNGSPHGLMNSTYMITQDSLHFTFPKTETETFTISVRFSLRSDTLKVHDENGVSIYLRSD